jgi:lysophospholipase L1-like esterase
MVGDSITKGQVPQSNAYRSRLRTLALADGYSVGFLGTQFNSVAPDAYTRKHEGINGDNAYDKRTDGPALNRIGLPTSLVSNFLGPGKIGHGVPIILVNLGTNPESDSGNSFATNYQTLIEQMHALEPQAKFVVNTIFSGGADGSVAATNATLATVWTNLTNEGITLFQATTTLTSGDLSDGTHPTDPAGYNKLGDDIYPQLKLAIQSL